MGRKGWRLNNILGLLGTFVTVRKSGINLTFCLHTVKNFRLLVLSETETVIHAYIAGTTDFKQIATATPTTARGGRCGVLGRVHHRSPPLARQSSTSSKRHPNSDYGVSRSFAFAASKTQGRRNY